VRGISPEQRAALDARNADIVRQYNEGVSIYDIAEQHGLVYNSVRYILERAIGKRELLRRKYEGHHDRRAAIAEKIKELKKQGLKYDDIAQVLGIKKNKVQDIALAFLTRDERLAHQTVKKEEYGIFIEDFRSGLSAKKIARKRHVAEQTVRSYIKENIPEEYETRCREYRIAQAAERVKALLGQGLKSCEIARAAKVSEGFVADVIDRERVKQETGTDTHVYFCVFCDGAPDPNPDDLVHVPAEGDNPGFWLDEEGARRLIEIREKREEMRDRRPYPVFDRPVYSGELYR